MSRGKNRVKVALRRAAQNIVADSANPISEFARAADLSVADAEAVAQNPENHGVNADKAAALVDAVSAEWGDFDTFRMCNGYESFE